MDKELKIILRLDLVSIAGIVLKAGSEFGSDYAKQLFDVLFDGSKLVQVGDTFSFKNARTRRIKKYNELLSDLSGAFADKDGEQIFYSMLSKLNRITKGSAVEITNQDFRDYASISGLRVPYRVPVFKQDVDNPSDFFRMVKSLFEENPNTIFALRYSYSKYKKYMAVGNEKYVKPLQNVLVPDGDVLENMSQYTPLKDNIDMFVDEDKQLLLDLQNGKHLSQDQQSRLSNLLFNIRDSSPLWNFILGIEKAGKSPTIMMFGKKQPVWYLIFKMWVTINPLYRVEEDDTIEIVKRYLKAPAGIDEKDFYSSILNWLLNLDFGDKKKVANKLDFGSLVGFCKFISATSGELKKYSAQMIIGVLFGGKLDYKGADCLLNVVQDTYPELKGFIGDVIREVMVGPEVSAYITLKMVKFLVDKNGSQSLEVNPDIFITMPYVLELASKDKKLLELAKQIKDSLYATPRLKQSIRDKTKVSSLIEIYGSRKEVFDNFYSNTNYGLETVDDKEFIEKYLFLDFKADKYKLYSALSQPADFGKVKQIYKLVFAEFEKGNKELVGEIPPIVTDTFVEYVVNNVPTESKEQVFKTYFKDVKSIDFTFSNYIRSEMLFEYDDEGLFSALASIIKEDIDNWSEDNYFDPNILMMLYKNDYFSETEINQIFQILYQSVISSGLHESEEKYRRKNFISECMKWLIEFDKNADYTMPLSKNASFKQIVKFMSYNDISFDVDADNFIGENFTLSSMKNETKKIQEVLMKANENVKRLELDQQTMKAINKQLVDGFYAGKHGNIYPIIHEIYEIELDDSEYKEWVAQYKDEYDNEVTPSFHGTGSVAANMISAFGFKVVRFDPETMTGRALGDGLYITNKIDKALLYASDEGYRKDDEFGYIFQLETLLGPEEFWRYDGPDTGSFLSPEWALKLPRKQTKIVRVMRVSAVEFNEYKNLVDPDYVYDPTNESVMSFKKFIAEVYDKKNYEVFAFRKAVPLPNGEFAETINDVNNEEWPDGVEIVVSNGFVNVMFPAGKTRLHRVFSGRLMGKETKKRFFSLLNKAKQASIKNG